MHFVKLKWSTDHADKEELEIGMLITQMKLKWWLVSNNCPQIWTQISFHSRLKHRQLWVSNLILGQKLQNWTNLPLRGIKRMPIWWDVFLKLRLRKIQIKKPLKMNKLIQIWWFRSIKMRSKKQILLKIVCLVKQLEKPIYANKTHRKQVKKKGRILKRF